MTDTTHATHQAFVVETDDTIVIDGLLAAFTDAEPALTESDMLAEFAQPVVPTDMDLSIAEWSDAVNTASHPDGGITIRMSLMEHFEGLEIPKYQSHLASGFDVPAAISEPISLNTIGATAMIPTGIKLEIPPGFEAQVRPRSGLAAKHGITVTNTPGTIDADYRGEIKVSLTKVNMSGGRFKVERGMRIAQIVICPVVQPKLEVVSDLSETERGERGFGSTGIK